MTPIPTWQDQPGLSAALEAAGISVQCRVGVWEFSDPDHAQAVAAAYNPVPYAQGVAIAAGVAQFNAVIAAGFAYQGKVYQLDPASQSNMTAMGAMALGSIGNPVASPWPSGFVWIAADNTGTAMTAQQCYAFTFAAGLYGSACVLFLRTLKDRILATASLAAVQAIDVTAGWPTNGA
jgi:hypothetical protein